MQNRGMKKWRPFATMPEQYRGLQEMIKKQAEVPQPFLTEDQMEQINFILIEALHTNKQTSLPYILQERSMHNRDRIHSVY
ncbi:YolD-like family protein [Priestia megaterium]|uniref:YolD-like family protein n=1 Tax=Priestia megaterium TaxID=1404 RepID=UPI0035CA2DFE